MRSRGACYPILPANAPPEGPNVASLAPLISPPASRSPQTAHYASPQEVAQQVVELEAETESFTFSDPQVRIVGRRLHGPLALAPPRLGQAHCLLDAETTRLLFLSQAVIKAARSLAGASIAADITVSRAFSSAFSLVLAAFPALACGTLTLSFFFLAPDPQIFPHDFPPLRKGAAKIKHAPARLARAAQ